MFLGSKEFPHILLISCVQQADGSDFGSGPDLVDVFVVDGRFLERSRVSTESAEQTFHVLMRRARRSRRKQDRSELLAEVSLELSHILPPLILPQHLADTAGCLYLKQGINPHGGSAQKADTSPGGAGLPS